MATPKGIEHQSTTERLARAALELHRLALTAAEVQHLPSPMAHREQTSKRGAQDPTATTALDERREAVAAQLARTMERVRDDYVENIAAEAENLRSALNQWDGR